MHPYTLLASAKINLYLEIVGDYVDTPGPGQPTGYHELVMILQSIDLADRITLQPLSVDTIRVHCTHPEVPTDERNLAHRAAALMQKEFPDAFARYGGIGIDIEKNIPVGAGLAGGSTNAAAVLIGLDLLWNLGLTQPELQDLGAKLGSDVPFCIMGGTVLATGRGEQLSPLPDLDNLWVVLGKFRSLSVSTGWAYQTYRQQFSHTYISDPVSLQERRERVHSSTLVSAIHHRDAKQIGQLLRNDLERIVLPQHPEVKQLRSLFDQPGVLGAMMSGSGPTVFALTETQEQAQHLKETIHSTIATAPEWVAHQADLDLWVTHLSPTSIQVVGS